MSTPNRPRVLNSSNGTPARRTGVPPRTPAATQTPRTSIRDQIKALRQAQATPQASSSTPRARARRDAVRELVRQSADTGRLVIPAHMEGSEGPALENLPLAMYTLLLGIPPAELSRKPPKPTKAPSSPFPGSRSSSSLLAQDMDALSLGKEDIFGEEQEDEQVGGFIGGRDLEVLKVGGQALTELDLELGLFGGLKGLDVRDNRLTSLPSSFPHLGQLTTLNLSHNHFSTFPAVLTLLPSLSHLDLSDNSLTLLDFTMPARAPMFPDSFSSPPPAPSVPDRPFPALRTLILEDNQLELDSLPSRWPENLDELRLRANALFPARGGLTRVIDLSKVFDGPKALRWLGLEGTGLAIVSGKLDVPSLQVLNLTSNPGLNLAGLEVDWKQTDVKLCVSESGQALAGRLEVILDSHLLVDRNPKPKRHVYVPPSPEAVDVALSSQTAVRREEDEKDPFWSSRARETAARRRAPSPEFPPLDTPPSRPTAARSRPTAFDDWETPSSLSTSSATTWLPPPPATAPSTPSRPTSTFVPSDPNSVYESSFSASSNTFQLSATSKTPLPSLPQGAFDWAALLGQSFAPSVRSIALSGRQIKRFANVPPPLPPPPSSSEDNAREACFEGVTELSLTQCPAHLSTIAPSLPYMFPNLRLLDVSESSVADSLFAHASLIRALLVDGRVEVVRGRESGVRSLAGLEEVARDVRDGRVGGWKCVEIDLQDNLVEKLDPVLGHLPLKTFLVDRNLFRSPNRRVWECDGTEGLLAWLRGSA